MSNPICAHCRWFKPDNSYITGNLAQSQAFCVASGKIDLVTGDELYVRCFDMRQAYRACGEKGKLFELNISDEEVSHGE
jgi:hypothetical protein